MVIAEQGGIYFDTDVELIRPIDELLTNPAFFGFEDSEHVNTGLGFGAEPGNPAVQAMLREYDVLFQGDIPAIGCPILNTAALVKMGLCLNGEKRLHLKIFISGSFSLQKMILKTTTVL